MRSFLDNEQDFPTPKQDISQVVKTPGVKSIQPVRVYRRPESLAPYPARVCVTDIR